MLRFAFSFTLGKAIFTSATVTARCFKSNLPDRLVPADEAISYQNGKPTNLMQAVNSAMDIALTRDSKVVHFGEDVGFGGVFRCSMELQKKHGKERVFDTPLCEQGIAGFAVGMASVGWKPIAEIQFADYIFPAFDQIVNEAAKYRYRTGSNFDVGGIVIRAPCGAVGHGGLYHSQSVEGFFAHAPGIKIVSPSCPADAKGLLLACVEEPDPCLFFEPKILYRTAVEDINPEYYTIPLGKGRILREGTDLTIVTYGAQVFQCIKAIDRAVHDGISVELIDLRTIVPWDREMVIKSVLKTRRCIVSHEASTQCGFAAELAAVIASDCFLHLEAPPARMCGLDTPFPLHEKLYLPNEYKVYDKIKELVKY